MFLKMRSTATFFLIAAISTISTAWSQSSSGDSAERKGVVKPFEPTRESDSLKPSEYSKYSSSLFIVKGDKGAGSGFFCKLNGKVVCLTNAHVLSGNTKLTFGRPGGGAVAVKPDQFSVAEDRDLAWFEPKSAEEGLELHGGGADLTIGDAVVCLGNSLGDDVVTEISGKVVGIGPEKIEVDCKFVAGNSGSPVIHVKSGKVIGVATSATVEGKTWVNAQTRFSEVRRWTTRIDGTKWVKVSWANFSKDAAFIDNYAAALAQNVAVFADLFGDGLLNAEGYEKSTVSVRSIVRAYVVASTLPTTSETDLIKAKKAFLRAMEFEVRKGAFDEFAAVRKRAQTMQSLHREKLLTEVESRVFWANKIRELEGALSGETPVLVNTDDPFWGSKKEPFRGQPADPFRGR